MNPDEIIEYATAIANGGPFKKSGIVAFMRTILASPEIAPPTELASEIVADATPLQTVAPMIVRPAIRVTELGKIHISSEVNGFYTAPEALALATELEYAARSLTE